jgi:xanthine dehydrogenase small subunit
MPKLISANRHGNCSLLTHTVQITLMSQLAYAYAPKTLPSSIALSDPDAYEAHTTMTAPLVFVWRDETVNLPNIPATRTLLQLLREDLNHSATKEGCNEGDCGACTVVLGEKREQQIRYSAVNSCIRLAHSIHGMALWTAADIAAADGTPHPVQQALQQCHASQCGFCTPGFAMSLFGMYQTLVLKDQSITRAQAQETLSGNLCRCTGYRPILDAAQQLTSLPKVVLDETKLLQQLEPLTRVNQGLKANFSYNSPESLDALLKARAAHPKARSWPVAPTWVCGSTSYTWTLPRFWTSAGSRNCA